MGLIHQIKLALLPCKCANIKNSQFRRLASGFLLTVYKNRTQINTLQVSRLQIEYLKGTMETCWPSWEQMSLWDHSWVNMHKQHLARNYPQTQGDGNKQALIFITLSIKRLKYVPANVWSDCRGYLQMSPSLTMMFLCGSSPTNTQTLCNHVEIRAVGGGEHKQSQTATFFMRRGKAFWGRNPGSRWHAYVK